MKEFYTNNVKLDSRGRATMKFSEFVAANYNQMIRESNIKS